MPTTIPSRVATIVQWSHEKDQLTGYVYDDPDNAWKDGTWVELTLTEWSDHSYAYFGKSGGIWIKCYKDDKA